MVLLHYGAGILVNISENNYNYDNGHCVVALMCPCVLGLKWSYLCLVYNCSMFCISCSYFSPNLPLMFHSSFTKCMPGNLEILHFNRNLKFQHLSMEIFIFWWSPWNFFLNKTFIYSNHIPEFPWHFMNIKSIVHGMHKFWSERRCADGVWQP